MDDLARVGLSFLGSGPRSRKDAVMFDIDDTLVTYSGELITPIIELAKISYELGFNIVIITARPSIPSTMRYTAEQLEAIGVRYHSLVFADAREKSAVKMASPYRFILSVGDQWTDLGASEHYLNTDTLHYL